MLHFQYHLAIIAMACVFSSYYCQDNIFAFSRNESVCIGETVTLTCYVYPPAGEDFGSLAELSFNGSTPRPFGFINDPANGLTAIGYSATVDISVIPAMGDSARIQLTISSYQVSDSNTIFAGHGVFDNNGSTFLVIQSPGPSIAAPPLTPATVVSLSSLSPTDCTNTLISWPSPDSDRAIDRYYVFRNSSLLANIPASNTQYTDTYQLMVNTPYSYSVVANSCAGNSSAGVDTVVIAGYQLSDSPPFFINYSSSDSMLLVDWTLKPNPGAPILLLYSLILQYSHSREGTNYSFSLATQFPLLSSAGTMRSVAITAHNFSSEDGLQTQVAAIISIVQQCGSSFMGVELRADYNSSSPPTRPTTIAPPLTTPNGTTMSSPTTPSITSTPPTQTPDGLPIGIIAGAVGGGAVILFILIIILVVIMLCICCGKKSESSKYPDHRRSDDNVELSGPGHSTDNIYPPEATYSQINKPQKTNPADLYSSVHKQAPPEKELLYADLDIVTSQTGRVHPPIAPHTNYTDLAQFPAADQTLYASVHTDGPN